MLLRPLALVALLLAAPALRAQDARSDGLPYYSDANGMRIDAPHSAWLDLRQSDGTYSKPQNTPAWVESVTLVNTPKKGDEPERSVFRIRVARPQLDLPLLLLRILFDDKPEQRPTITIWDESGTQVMQSGALGAGLDLPTSDSVLLPMIGISCIDLEVPGDGSTIRGAFLDWMMSRPVAHPATAQKQDIIAEPFAASPHLQAPSSDTESFGTVTAPLAAESIRVGASVQTGAAFQFGIETQPLLALLSFEVNSARVDSPPEIFLNGQSLGPVSLTLPDLADPAYRGETSRLIGPMRFGYTGWIRAQKLIPASSLRVGTNDLVITGGAGAPASAIRATQIQLKYLWDKSDYLLRTDP